MSSTIIPGVSDQLGVNYLKAFNAANIMYMVTCQEHWETPHFSTCFKANDYANSLIHERGIDPSKISIYLIQINGPTLLTQEEVISLAAFETDDQLYSMFQIYAEKMSRPGRVAAAARAAQDEDEDEYEDDEDSLYNWNGYGEDDDEQEEKPIKELDWVRWAQERERLEKSSIEDELRSKLVYADEKIAKLEKQVEKTRRELAMEWIMSMKPEEFEQRLLINSPNYKLPDFPRAQLGDEDYPDLTMPQRQIAAPDYKHPLMPREHELGKSNYACLHRKDLLYMSEKKFRDCAYEKPTYAVYDGSWPCMSHTGVSDFDVYR
uniref:Uncharacterized protein n=1 Tax=viral metagenome TaxID=1070528 RepID=A0A6C0ART2_9ZZZZ